MLPVTAVRKVTMGWMRTKAETDLSSSAWETRGPRARASLSGICQHSVSSANASTSPYSVATSSVSPITNDDFGRVCRDDDNDGKFRAWLDVGAPSEEGAWEYGNPRAEGGLNDRAETILCCGPVRVFWWSRTRVQNPWMRISGSDMRSFTQRSLCRQSSVTILPQ